MNFGSVTLCPIRILVQSQTDGQADRKNCHHAIPQRCEVIRVLTTLCVRLCTGHRQHLLANVYIHCIFSNKICFRITFCVNLDKRQIGVVGWVLSLSLPEHVGD